MSISKETNLFKANSVNTNDKPFIKSNILKSVREQTTDYVNYIKRNRDLVQKDGAIKIPLKKKEIRYYLKFNKFSKEESAEIKELVFKNEFKRVSINNTNQQVEIESKNIKEDFVVLKDKNQVKSITIKWNDKLISLNYKSAIVFNVLTDKLNDRDKGKVEIDLFERNVYKVYTEQPNSNKNKALGISIKARNATENFIVLDTIEKLEFVYLKANDYQLKKQLEAIEALRNNPRKEHTPLQKLFDSSSKSVSYFEENIEYNHQEINFEILNDPEKYDGTNQQQDFVKKALRTKDFALLEGPPGSGKTTAIIELIIQLIKQNKRVLLVSATHVAVDNVVHRMLTTYKKQCEGLVVPIRIASNNSDIRKETVEPYELKTFIEKTKSEIVKNIESSPTSKSGVLLSESINSKSKSNDENTFDDLILKSANLVGGTMIGILQHPDIKNKKPGLQELFDVMIVDESSKVTFLDFIVPALYAKKWILVGDINQLSPYTEDNFINENIDSVINDNVLKDKIIGAYNVNKKLVSNEKWNKRTVKILFSKNHNEHDFAAYEVFKIPTNFEANEKNILKLNSVDLIICEPTEINKKIITEHVYVKAQVFENKIDQISFKNRQKSFHKNKGKRKNFPTYPFEFIGDKKQEWKELVGSNLNQIYQYRLDKKSNEEYKKEFEFLVPEEYRNGIENIRRIAMPSILELLQIGVGESKRKKDANQLIYKGFKEFDEIIKNKFQSLTYQHRMENEIASLSRKHFYKNENLTTAKTVTKIRVNHLSWYKPNEDKVIWIPNQDNTFREKSIKGASKNINPTEVRHIKEELENFLKLARNKPKEDGTNYEIAVLTFYTQQVGLIRQMLKVLSNNSKQYKVFTTGNVEITLSTVDKFQGDEADMVLLSFVKPTPKAFYNSPNRLNVALTRARFKLILYGNNKELIKKAQLDALREIASDVDSKLRR